MIFISFLWDDLLHVRRLLPDAKIQFLFSSRSERPIGELIGQRFDVDIYYRDLTEEKVVQYHAAGMEVNCWTVDDPADAERLIAMGVDYITSNILE